MEKRPRVERNRRLKMDGYAMLRALDSETAALAFCDPQYRAVLDKQSYGNEGKRQSARAKLRPMTAADVGFLVEEIGRVLRPSAHMALWMDKYSLASAHYHHWLDRAGVFQIVDLFAWNKGRIGMGYRGRGIMEYVVIAQKHPVRAKDVWRDRGMPDGFIEMKELAGHPHAKPMRWTKRLVLSVTKPGDLVVDPCAGGFGVLDVCRATGREFVGCDLEG